MKAREGRITYDLPYFKSTPCDVIFLKGYVMKKQIALLLISVIFPLPILTQTVVLERVYRVDSLKSSTFSKLAYFPLLDTQYFYSAERQITKDTNYLVFTKLDKEGNLVLVKRYSKVIGGKLKQIYYSNLPLKFEQEDGKNYICAVNFIPMAASLGFAVGFWLYVTKFDTETGQLVYEGIDTSSKHTMTYSPEGPGRVFELNNLYYNFSIYRDTILVKIFMMNGSFVSEKRIAKMYLPKGSYYFSADAYLEIDSSFILILQKEGLTLKEMPTYIIKINKQFGLDWLKPLVMEGDTLKILAVEKNKLNKLIALCFKDVDSTFYITVLEPDGSISSLKQLVLDKYIKVYNIKQISDGGYILLGQYSTERDTSKGVFVKISKDYEIEQIFSQKLEAPWNTFNQVFELPDHSFVIGGYCDYFPYLLILKDVIVSVNEKDNKQSTLNSLAVDDYLYLDKLIKPEQKITIYSLLGVKVFEGISQSIIDVKEFTPGVYFLMVGGKIYKFFKL